MGLHVHFWRVKLAFNIYISYTLAVSCLDMDSGELNGNDMSSKR